MAENNKRKKSAAPAEAREYLSVREVAAMSGLSYGTVRRAIEQGRLAAYRIGRKFFIRAEAADGFCREQQGGRAGEGYTIRELMSKLSLSYAFVSELLKSGELKSRRVGRQYIVSKADFEEFMQKKRL